MAPLRKFPNTGGTTVARYPWTEVSCYVEVSLDVLCTYAACPGRNDDSSGLAAWQVGRVHLLRSWPTSHFEMSHFSRLCPQILPSCGDFLK